MAGINTAAAECVAAKLREQESAHTQIAAILLLKPAADLTFAVDHQEIARLFGLLRDAVEDGLLDRLQDEARTAVPA